MKNQIYLQDMLKNKKDTDRFLDEVLKEDPGFKLPGDFADNLTIKFEKYFAWNYYIREFLIYFFAGIGILAATTAMLFFLMAETWQKWVDILLNNLEGSIGIVVLLTFILFIDKVLLQYFSFKLKYKTA